MLSAPLPPLVKDGRYAISRYFAYAGLGNGQQDNLSWVDGVGIGDAVQG